jgi:maltose alpha-D-glucosyltransferase/alpha-amylase
VDRNSGFSRADFAQLYLPPLMDPVYGYQAINVEAQLRNPTSLLHWLRRFIALRKEHPVLGLGTYELLKVDNPRVFAHCRRHEDEIVLCVHNLARSAQPVQLDLGEFEGATPVEMFGGTRFPRIGELPYLITLGSRGFFWFQLQVEDEAGEATRAQARTSVRATRSSTEASSVSVGRPSASIRTDDSSYQLSGA